MRESDIEAYLVREVRRLGGLAVKHISPGRSGDPDRLVKLPGKPMALAEIKRPGEVARPDQEARLCEWAQLGVLVGMLSTKWQIDQFLRKAMDQ